MPQNQCFISTCRDRWRNPLTRGFRGYDSSASSLGRMSISDRSTGGKLLHVVAQYVVPPAVMAVALGEVARQGRVAMLCPQATRGAGGLPTATTRTNSVLRDSKNSAQSTLALECSCSRLSKRSCEKCGGFTRGKRANINGLRVPY